MQLYKTTRRKCLADIQVDAQSERESAGRGDDCCGGKPAGPEAAPLLVVTATDSPERLVDGILEYAEQLAARATSCS